MSSTWDNKDKAKHVHNVPESKIFKRAKKSLKSWIERESIKQQDRPGSRCAMILTFWDIWQTGWTHAEGTMVKLTELVKLKLGLAPLNEADKMPFWLYFLHLWRELQQYRRV